MNRKNFLIKYKKVRTKKRRK